MYKEPNKIKIKWLKSEEEYIQELKEINDELGLGLETDTLIKSDLDMLRRSDEIFVILSFIASQKKKKEKNWRN